MDGWHPIACDEARGLALVARVSSALVVEIFSNFLFRACIGFGRDKWIDRPLIRRGTATLLLVVRTIRAARMRG